MRVEPYPMFAGRREDALAFRRHERPGAELRRHHASITADNGAQARRPFDAPAEGGSVFMPLGPSFRSPCLGMCSDGFGMQWMVGLDGPQA